MTPHVEDLALTPRMAQVIKVFVEHPLQERYGFELMQVTGLPSGTLYPVLAKFEAAGWLTGGKENINPRAEGRPARRFYRISAAVLPAARQQLGQLSELYRLPIPETPQPAAGRGAA